MRAAVLRHGAMVVDEVPDPVPGMGQVLVRTLGCGICGSDLHFVKHGRRMSELAAQSGVPDRLDFERDIFMGHEFSAEVLDCGPETSAPPPGTVVTSMPGMLTLEGPKNLAYTNEFAAGYSERMLLSAPLLLEVPNGLDPRHAALTEPMAVGVHAVNRSGIRAGESALVHGCGPVGLAVVASLRAKGVEPIIATDFSATRRRLATTMGAHDVIDPRREPGIEAWRRIDGVRPLVIFEAVGVPGMLESALEDAPSGARILVVGVCMETDNVYLIFGILKELSVQFALGYDPMEFAASLQAIAEGELDVAPLITGSVDLNGLPAAFELLANPDSHGKILMEPSGR
ncbi:MAG TPA: zinc-binding dehydrogenase [Acidimicrobiales bacterium]|nr:zinc-binding dehydrogenase [Acidimicrobiales bacterium]